MSSNAQRILRKSSRTSVTLPAATEAARRDGELGPDESITVTIRKVRASEVLAAVGTPPRLFALARDRRPDETPEQQRQRVQDAMTQDADVLQDTYRQAEATQRAIVRLGIVDPPMTDDGAGDTLTPDDLGDDFAVVHNAIIDHATLPYGRLGVARTDTFLDGALADDPEPDGGEVRDDPSSPPG